MKFDHVAVTSKCIQTSIDWYKKTFSDVVVEYADDTWAIIDVNGLKLSFVSPKQHPPHTAFCITKEYAEANLSHKKFKVHRDGTSSCYVNDPDGNKIEWLIRGNDE